MSWVALCDDCGSLFDPSNSDCLFGVVNGVAHDMCEACADRKNATVCGGCSEIMQWDDLNGDYLCCVCERAG